MLPQGSIFLYSNGAAHNVRGESVGYGTAELLTERICVKFLNVHYRCEILAREPAFTLAFILAANIPGIAARRVRACAIVDEQTVGVERLRKRYVDELAVGSQRHTDG